ncbi:divergent polysaccharide deacetylase family protein [Roseomonas nepalensis]|uniref:Divergent polysaccharide deacetylase family protein n=1 Tax=Muricoccus nepalensis TaxID=1854500 RepID=A0A502G9Y6_9PROT|nr:divergent polysaccharide deacetylase family protein [Roseomonas nepalensis]TPG58987.1 divergent polysaccharide deacetylase family protein [Roseomonas nepalensis]
MRALGVFWLAVLALLGAGAAVLHGLGPPEGGIPPGLVRAPEPSAATAEAPAPAPEPAPEPPAARAEAAPPAPATPTAEPPAARPAEPPAAPDAAALVALPSAPEPPPLPSAARRAEAPPDRPIPLPDPALQEPSRYGPVPKLGPEGRTSIRAYGRPFDRGETRPRVALVVGNLGLSASLSEEAIGRLPPATGLAFSPYAPRPDPLLERARLRGMEVLTAIPMEPANYPANDPGDRALLTTLPASENGDRLAWIMSRIGGQVGAIGALGPMRGERFAALPESIGGVQDVLRERGLLYIDPRPGAPSPGRAWGRSVDVVVDEPATRGEIDRRLADLERLAREKGSALGLAADVSPVLVDRVAAWAAGLEARGVVMAPVTALIRRPEEIPR